MEVTKPTLTYFHLPGRGALPRLLLELAGADYHYESISYNKSPGHPWDEYKPKLGDVLTFGQIPLYSEPGGLNIVQSSSIARYLARKHGFSGSNEVEAVAIDVFHEGVEDLFKGYTKAAWADASTRAVELPKFVSEVAPKWLGHFSKALNKNHEGKGFLVGEKISYADVAFWWVLRVISQLEGGQAALEHFPVLTAYQIRIGEIPNIKHYIDSDPFKF